MAACGGLQHIFENPIPENPTLLESLSSWKQVMPLKPLDEQSPFTEIFGELHFKESPQFQTDFSRKRNESLQLCTEGLGFESSDDHVEDLKSKFEQYETKNLGEEEEEEEKSHQSGESCEKSREETETCNNFKRSRISGGLGAFPPPISCIGKSGKPWVCLKAYRENGRFVLKEVRIPTQEFLHACREDGRLKLQFVQPADDTIFEEEETNEEFQDDDEEEEEEKEMTDKRGEEKIAGYRSNAVER